MERYEDKPFAIVGVNCHDDEETFRNGVREYGVTWTNAFQRDGAPIAEMWGVNAFPTMHIIDADGRIAAMRVRGKQIERTVDALLEKLEKAGDGK